jgi:hypothetical protein
VSDNTTYQEIESSILGMIARVVQGGGAAGKTVYDVQCGDGVVRQIWSPEVAEGVKQYVNPAGTGPVIPLRVRSKQNGQYVNQSIVAFAKPGEQLAAYVPKAGGYGGRGGGMSPEDKTRITKLGAIGSATQLVGSLLQGAGPEAFDEALALVDKAAQHIYKAARSHETTPAPVQTQMSPQGGVVGSGPILPTASTPQEVAAQVPGVQVGAPVAAPPQPAATPQAPQASDVEWE